MLLFGTEQSFRKAKWLPQGKVLELKPQLLRNFIQRRHDSSNDEFGVLVNGVHPDSMLVERVIAQKSTLQGQLFLTKWRSLAYSESTWESEEDLKDDKVGSYCLLGSTLQMLMRKVVQQLTTQLGSGPHSSNRPPPPPPKKCPPNLASSCNPSGSPFDAPHQHSCGCLPAEWCLL